MQDLLSGRFSIRYERDASSSYLVLCLYNEAIIDCHVEMIGNNPAASIVPLSVRQKDDKINIYYNITSKQSLQHFLKRKKLKRDEVINILVNVTKTLLACKNYFLMNKNFLLNEEFIYINPATLEIALIYLPIAIEKDFAKSFKDFITNMIIHTANIDESYSDNYIQRILNFIKTDTFNALGFSKLLSELSNGNTLYTAEYPEIKSEPQNLSVNSGNISQNLKIHIPQPIEQLKVDVMKTSYKPNIILAAVLSQVLLAIVGIVLYNVVLTKQGMDSSSVLGLILLAGVVDFLVLKNLFNKENIEFDKKNIEAAKAPLSKEKPASKEAAIKAQLELVKPLFTEDDSAFPVQNGGGADDTVILGKRSDRYPCLKSTESGVNEKILITKPSFIIGRLRGQVDYVVKNNAIGKVHAEITHKNGLHYIKDLNSRNGTLVNGNRITSNIEYQISDNDRISLAHSEYIFQI